MENTESWNTFARTGRVSDYLNYANQNASDRNSDSSWTKRKEERGRREGASDGNGAFGGGHW